MYSVASPMAWAEVEQAVTVQPPAQRREAHHVGGFIFDQAGESLQGLVVNLHPGLAIGHRGHVDLLYPNLFPPAKVHVTIAGMHARR